MRRFVPAVAGLLLAGCGTNPELGPVLDDANLIPATDEARLESELRDYFKASGRSIVVATTPSLKGQSIESYATGMFNRLGIGDRRTNQGLLLLVAPNERSLRIEVGRGLATTVSNAKAADIIDQAIVLHFRKNDFVGGIDEGVHALIVTNECNLRDGVAALCPSKAGT